MANDARALRVGCRGGSPWYASSGGVALSVVTEKVFAPPKPIDKRRGSTATTPTSAGSGSGAGVRPLGPYNGARQPRTLSEPVLSVASPASGGSGTPSSRASDLHSLPSPLSAMSPTLPDVAAPSFQDVRLLDCQGEKPCRWRMVLGRAVLISTVGAFVCL